MAKDSNKRAVLAKRRVELLHAIAHDFSETVVSQRLEKLRFAALKLIKKESNVSLHGSTNYDELTEKWNSLSQTQILELANDWPDNPSIRDLQHCLK